MKWNPYGAGIFFGCGLDLPNQEEYPILSITLEAITQGVKEHTAQNLDHGPGQLQLFKRRLRLIQDQVPALLE